MKSFLRTGALLIITLAITVAGYAAPSSESLAAAARLRRKTLAASRQVEAPTPPDTNVRHQGTLVPSGQTTYNGYLERAYTDAQGNRMAYYLHLPPLPGTARYPVVLLLEGVGERSSSSATLEQNRAKVVDTPYIRQWTSTATQSRWPSFIIVPQVSNQNRWVNVVSHNGPYQLAPEPTTSLALAKDILEQVEMEYSASIDRSRIYVTGISMGGFGAWDAIERWPQEFSAAAPVSGAGDLSRVGALVKMPIWVFHGTLDTTVPVSASREMVAALISAGGNPRYTEYPDGHHDIWVRVYSSTAFLSWLFAQRSPTVMAPT